MPGCLDAVPLGQLADPIVAFLRERREDHQAQITWRERSAFALARSIWSHPITPNSLTRGGIPRVKRFLLG
jgi:hypothetical protein